MEVLRVLIDLAVKVMKLKFNVFEYQISFFEIFIGSMLLYFAARFLFGIIQRSG
ncbi:hypothetical protein [Caloranaerobacter ferrireducens]|uniref:hypothetical protein n=1 Tax=Caloranaerobacter ferrireducens TaxID=1323370 RepID=UPI00159F3390|nr:hypothetical protein [Caloranaerobacter ferrireducens]